MALGPRDMSTLVTMTGWDTTVLQNFQLQDGTTYAQIVGEMNAALGALNMELATDPLWASLASFSDRPDLTYRMGGSNGMGRFTEYARADTQRADLEGHMLPLTPWDRALGWTWKYLKEARRDEVQNDIRDAIQDVRDRWRIQILTRLLQRGDDSGESNGLGTSGYSAGFATDAGSTNVDFTPPSYGGVSFTSAHEHYVPIAGGVYTAAVFTDAKNELREHGHEPPYDFLASASDESTIKGLTGFVGTGSDLVRYGALQDVALLDPRANAQGGYYIGTINDFAVRIVLGMPQYYGFGYKSYGRNSQRNPLRIRLEKGRKSPMVTAMADPRAGNGTTPLQFLMLYLEFGVGVADRTNGTARYVNNAAWTDGVPT